MAEYEPQYQWDKLVYPERDTWCDPISQNAENTREALRELEDLPNKRLLSYLNFLFETNYDSETMAAALAEMPTMRSTGLSKSMLWDWLDERHSISETNSFKLCFGLDLFEREAWEFLIQACGVNAFNPRDVKHVIYRYCLNTENLAERGRWQTSQDMLREFFEKAIIAQAGQTVYNEIPDKSITNLEKKYLELNPERREALDSPRHNTTEVLRNAFVNSIHIERNEFIEILLNEDNRNKFIGFSRSAFESYYRMHINLCHHIIQDELMWLDEIKNSYASSYPDYNDFISSILTYINEVDITSIPDIAMRGQGKDVSKLDYEDREALFSDVASALNEQEGDESDLAATSTLLTICRLLSNDDSLHGDSSFDNLRNYFSVKSTKDWWESTKHIGMVRLWSDLANLLGLSDLDKCEISHLKRLDGLFSEIVPLDKFIRRTWAKKNRLTANRRNAVQLLMFDDDSNHASIAKKSKLDPAKLGQIPARQNIRYFTNWKNPDEWHPERIQFNECGRSVLYLLSFFNFIYTHNDDIERIIDWLNSKKKISYSDRQEVEGELFDTFLWRLKDLSFDCRVTLPLAYNRFDMLLLTCASGLAPDYDENGNEIGVRFDDNLYFEVVEAALVNSQE